MKPVPAITAALTAAAVLLTMSASVSAQHGRAALDLQAHRGGRGLVVENTLAAFGNAMELGVGTLELDIQITRDSQAIVAHDAVVMDTKCVDTAPAFADDPQYPYVGKQIKSLTAAQIATLDCGSLVQPEFDGQRAKPGERMPLLREVFDLAKSYQAKKIKYNIEIKVDSTAEGDTAPREKFVEVITDEIKAAGTTDRVAVQSFDWASLMLVHDTAPRLKLNVLSDYHRLEVGKPGASPWLGGLDIDDFDGDPIAAIATFGATAYSPVHGFPKDASSGDDGYKPYITAELVKHAHANKIAIVAWTVEDAATMNKLIDDGVDAIITDYPDVLRKVMKQRGLPLPPRYAASV